MRMARAVRIHTYIYIYTHTYIYTYMCVYVCVYRRPTLEERGGVGGPEHARHALHDALELVGALHQGGAHPCGGCRCECCLAVLGTRGGMGGCVRKILACAYHNLSHACTH